MHVLNRLNQLLLASFLRRQGKPVTPVPGLDAPKQKRFEITQGLEVVGEADTLLEAWQKLYESMLTMMERKERITYQYLSTCWIVDRDGPEYLPFQTARDRAYEQGWKR